MAEKVILAERMTDDALLSYHKFMGEAYLKIPDVSTLAICVWSDVLKELDKRGKVRLVSGSYDDIGNALIQDL
ncbi:hypothetical protein [Paracoccus sp. (in: a-proteobacteria)]|uniref:hypothetical protein n=1 Tax=Paracoccus sp. TaxID=267 RepID=UPI002AFF205E|nr:hypothetical protein [Paracoccus sp. (in: a-proteobacteria)]